MNEQTQNIQFVLEVEKRPCLYNHQLPEHSLKDVVERAWEEVGAPFNLPGAACKEKWKNLRTVLLRHIRATSNGSSRRVKRPYYLRNAMQFLIPHLKVAVSSEAGHMSTNSLQNNISNLEESEDSLHMMKVEELEEDLEFAFASTSTRLDKMSSDPEPSICRPPKRVRTDSDADDHNPRRMFLLSLLPEIDELTEEQMKAFRRKSLQLLDEITS